MGSPIIDSEQTNVPCPGRGCGEKLVRLIRQVEGTPKTFDDWTCPVIANHVAQQWQPPTEW
jgi:hypothetical protein